MKAKIRKMVQEDWNCVRDIYEQGIRTGNATFETCAPEFDIWDASHHKDTRLVAVDSKGVVCGFAALTPVSGRCVYAGVGEVSIYVGESCRHQGVGARLLIALIEESEKHGFWTLQSGLFEENTASLKLHLKCGFRLVGYRERIGRDCQGKWRNTVLLERRSTQIGID